MLSIRNHVKSNHEIACMCSNRLDPIDCKNLFENCVYCATIRMWILIIIITTSWGRSICPCLLYILFDTT